MRFVDLLRLQLPFQDTDGFQLIFLRAPRRPERHHRERPDPRSLDAVRRFGNTSRPASFISATAFNYQLNELDVQGLTRSTSRSHIISAFLVWWLHRAPVWDTRQRENNLPHEPSTDGNPPLSSRFLCLTAGHAIPVTYIVQQLRLRQPPCSISGSVFVRGALGETNARPSSELFARRFLNRTDSSKGSTLPVRDRPTGAVFHADGKPSAYLKTFASCSWYYGIALAVFALLPWVPVHLQFGHPVRW